jgi:hypothetical protein
VNSIWKTIIWQQFGAAIDMLENAVLACPEEVWSDRTRQPQFWYVTYHALFWLDLYLSDSLDGFAPPPPFKLDDMEAGVIPDQYTREELQKYVEHGREKCRTVIANLSDEKAEQRCGFEWVDVSHAELLLYNMRHVQHHVAQLNLILRQTIDSAPGWVSKAKSRL